MGWRREKIKEGRSEGVTWSEKTGKNEKGMYLYQITDPLVEEREKVATGKTGRSASRGRRWLSRAYRKVKER